MRTAPKPILGGGGGAARGSWSNGAPPSPTAPTTTPLLRRPRAAGATDPGVTLPTANDDQGGQAAESALIRGPPVPEMSTAGTSDATGPSPVMAR